LRSDRDRRDFLRAAGGALSAAALQGLAARAAALAGLPNAKLEALTTNGGYGPLAPSRTVNTGEALLHLPDGFACTAFGRTGAPMTDGRPTPPAHDGMAAFQVGSEIRLVRNHEVVAPPGQGRALAPAEVSYDPAASGGTTTLVIDPRRRVAVHEFVSLSGTHTNCAGGPTPWGSWLSCEETTAGPASGCEKPHGYCFEVSARANAPVVPVPLKAMGRFIHEAVAVDPASGIVYLTEDRFEAGLYRFIPSTPGQLGAGGRLEMLGVRGRPRYDTRTGQQPFLQLPVTWVPILNPDPSDAESNSGAVYQQGIVSGGATFTRLEGAWFGGGALYVDATIGGDQRLGQIWEYHPGADGGMLRLGFESTSAAVLNRPDNLCVSPRGKGLVLCEDGEGVQFLRGLTREGRIFDFARNAVPGSEHQEFAGATFSPDGRTLFVNVQIPGVTFAIWGPWRRGGL